MTRGAQVVATGAVAVMLLGVVLGARALTTPPAAAPTPTGPKTFHVDVPGIGGNVSYPFDLVDEANIVEAFIRAAPEELGPFPRLTNIPGRPNGLHLSIMGGACDGGARMLVGLRDGVYGLTITTNHPAVDCVDVGLVHGFVIDLRVPVDASRMSLGNEVTP